MIRKVLHSKIHMARCTRADLEYVGSIVIDADLLEASGMRADLPVLAVQPRALSEGGPLPDRFDAIIDECTATILARQPAGPYGLAGWSFGGVVAHAIATRLQARGEKVERLILFDSYPMPPEAEPDYSNPDAVWKAVALVAGLEIDPDTSAISAQSFRAAAAQQGHLFGEFPEEQLERLAGQLANNTHLLPQADLKPFNGDVTLYTASLTTEGLDRSGADPGLWHPYITGQLDIVPIAAEHHTMLSPQAIRQIGTLPI